MQVKRRSSFLFLQLFRKVVAMLTKVRKALWRLQYVNTRNIQFGPDKTTGNAQGPMHIGSEWPVT
ncbi:hypothetical protein RvY_01138 [Ramazzottius varieornatus]|uniref:Uncharacterized protein n=1 Tax=Ramazzottius varieornatus TaxID=947166 RepID=A0A1D1UQK4_RAMVA|nr:hypothetical protein RvY_01138 [Ramazzottius varieornatus]